LFFIRLLGGRVPWFFVTEYGYEGNDAGQDSICGFEGIQQLM